MQAEVQIPSVAIVILNWNGRKYLQEYLPSVMSGDYENFRVIVADNASTDDSINFLAEHFPAVQIILLDQNYGFAEGYNRALHQVSADYFVLLNSDVAVTPGWIKPVISLMESDKNIAACQPKILSARNPARFEYAGASGGWLDRFGYPFCRGRVFDLCEEDAGQYDDVSEVFWASGACFFVRPQVFRSLGGFDPFFFAHQEEIDLCWRMKNSGFRICTQPASIVYHLGGGSLEMGDKRKVFLNFRNNLIMLFKNLNRGERWKKILPRLILDGIAGLQFLSKGKGGSFIAVIKAHRAFFSWKKNQNQASLENSKLSELPGSYDGSIVWDFFIKKKKRFSEIVQNKK